MKHPTHIFVFFMLVFVISCGPSLVIQNVDYSQPIESVLVPDSENVVYDQRYAIKFNISPLLEHEGINSVSEVHLIQHKSGSYFVTAPGFTNVYVFAPGEGQLALKTETPVSPNGIGDPAFNQKGDTIELVDLENDRVYQLTEEGILNQ